VSVCAEKDEKKEKKGDNGHDNSPPHQRPVLRLTSPHFASPHLTAPALSNCALLSNPGPYLATSPSLVSRSSSQLSRPDTWVDVDVYPYGCIYLCWALPQTVVVVAVVAVVVVHRM